MPKSQEIYDLLDEENYGDLKTLLQEEFLFTNEDDLEMLFAMLLYADSLSNKSKASLAQKIVSHIDLRLLDDEKQINLTWGVANPRGEGGVDDLSFLALQSMISAGFNINYAKRGGGDLFSEVSRQAGGSYANTDAELIKLTLGTVEVKGFEGELKNQVIQDLENPKFTKAVLLHLRATEKGFNYEHNLYQNRHQIYSEWRPSLQEIEFNTKVAYPTNSKTSGELGVFYNIPPIEIATLNNAKQLTRSSKAHSGVCTIL
jgi:hypothetical protein